MEAGGKTSDFWFGIFWPFEVHSSVIWPHQSLKPRFVFFSLGKSAVSAIKFLPRRHTHRGAPRRTHIERYSIRADPRLQVETTRKWFAYLHLFFYPHFILVSFVISHVLMATYINWKMIIFVIVFINQIRVFKILQVHINILLLSSESVRNEINELAISLREV